MPRGPKGERRPADVIGNAVKVMRIATGEESDKTSATHEGAKRGGTKGGSARAEHLTPEQRSEAARLASQARWRRKPD